MEWAEKIRYIEKELEIEADRGRLAHLLGVRPGIISDIKKGKAKNPSANLALLLINKLGVNPTWLEEEKLPVFFENERLKKQPFAGYFPPGKRLKKQPTSNTGQFSDFLPDSCFPAKGQKTDLQGEESGSTMEDEPEAGGAPGSPSEEGKGTLKTDVARGGAVSGVFRDIARKEIPVIVEGQEPGRLIPVVNQGVSAGFGFEYDEGETVRYIKIPSWIARRGRDLVALPIYGDSMEPTVHQGEMIVCDSGGFKDNGLYVLRDETRGLYLCKRVAWTPGGWVIMSDNPRYEQMEVKDRDIEIVARVLAAIKEVK
jgi:phage repressor protein C with HTH and peptisase S24 domain/transcriptional regulator with XRE-family HTH domain